MKSFFKVLGVLFTILFAVGAAVQYNDPDALLWILIYGTAAMLSLAFVFNKANPTVLLFVGVVCLIGFLYLYPADFQGFDLNDGDIKTVELGREAFGLLIISIAFLTFGFWSRRK